MKRIIHPATGVVCATSDDKAAELGWALAGDEPAGTSPGGDEPATEPAAEPAPAPRKPRRKKPEPAKPAGSGASETW